MANGKQVTDRPLEIGGRDLSLPRAVGAGDFVFLTGQILMPDGAPKTTGSIECQPHAVRRNRADFPCFTAVYARYFPDCRPAKSTVISGLQVEGGVDIEVVARRPIPVAAE